MFTWMEIVHSRNNKLRARFRSLYCIPILSGYVISKCRISNVIIYRFIYFFLFLSHALFLSYYNPCWNWKFYLFIYSFLLKEKISFHILVGKFRKIISSLCYYFEILPEFVTISINIEQKNIGYNKLNRNIRLSNNISNWISLRINMGN